jgi:hypothetical protein
LKELMLDEEEFNLFKMVCASDEAKNGSNGGSKCGSRT